MSFLHLAPHQVPFARVLTLCDRQVLCTKEQVTASSGQIPGILVRFPRVDGEQVTVAMGFAGPDDRDETWREIARGDLDTDLITLIRAEDDRRALSAGMEATT